MSQPLKFKNVFLTGGAQGLGKSYVDALLEAGAKVVFGDINAEVGTVTEKEFMEKYGKENVMFLEFDVTDGPKFEEAFQTAVTRLGHIDLMVNNAGIMNELLWEKMIQLNYTGAVRGTLMAHDHMRRDRGGKGGRIINISSVAGLEDDFRIPVYCGTKQAIRAFTSSLAVSPDVRELGVEYAILCPGAVATDLVLKDLEHRIKYFESIPPESEDTIVSLEHVQSAFMKLVLLEEMNGAILEVTLGKMNFCRMEKVDLGEDWPAKEDLSSPNS